MDVIYETELMRLEREGERKRNAAEAIKMAACAAERAILEALYDTDAAEEGRAIRQLQALTPHPYHSPRRPVGAKAVTSTLLDKMEGR